MEYLWNFVYLVLCNPLIVLCYLSLYQSGGGNTYWLSELTTPVVCGVFWVIVFLLLFFYFMKLWGPVTQYWKQSQKYLK